MQFLHSLIARYSVILSNLQSYPKICCHIEQNDGKTYYLGPITVYRIKIKIRSNKFDPKDQN